MPSALIRLAAAIALSTAVLPAQEADPVIRTLSAPNAVLAPGFTRIASVRSLADGRLLVLDAGDKKVLIAEWASRAATQIGREGRGPAEYASPSILIALPADSTIVVDPAVGRWLILHRSDIVGMMPPDAVVLRAGARVPFGADDRGRVYDLRGDGGTTPFGGAMSISIGASVGRDSTALIRTSRTTGHADTIARLRARPSRVAATGTNDKGYSFKVQVNPLAAGEQAVLSGDGWIAIARLDPYRVDWIGPDGTRVQGKPLPFVNVAIDEREQRATMSRIADRRGGEPQDPSTMTDWPTTLPPFLGDALHVAPDGRLWVHRAPRASTNDTRYDVVDRRGVLVARVAMGAREQLIGFGSGAVFTVTTDDDGLQRLRRHAMPKL